MADAVRQEGASSRTGAKDGEFEETTLSRLQIWEQSNLGKSTLSEVRNSGVRALVGKPNPMSAIDPKRSFPLTIISGP